MDCKHASPASDMWSLGATAFQLLSGGVAPFWAGFLFIHISVPILSTCDDLYKLRKELFTL